MRTLELIKEILKLDFTSTIIERDSGSVGESDFELKPRDFLRLSKKDFKTDSDGGLINALTNAKRAIDCQIDTSFNIFGISYDNISMSSEDLVKLVNIDASDLPFKLKLVRALDFAPSGVISNIRTLRNKLEHYYKKPEKNEVDSAIELAELFILSVENRIRFIEENLSLTDRKNYIEYGVYNSSVNIDFCKAEKHFKLDYYKARKKIETEIIDEHQPLFYCLIRILNNINEDVELLESLKIFLKMIEHPIPLKNVKLDI
ncbi:MAG: hypothetical protein PF436_03775 [Prolixibacteraceae bacterium]|jgi:hypothetical protein|nr:hypothetical protein [Prolixibacteraceae bacterium]